MAHREAQDAAVNQQLERHLAAIVAADVVGYSRLMGEDEAWTLACLKSYRNELIDPAIAAHKGKIVKTTGDGLLLTFPSVVEAVSCAIDMQSALAQRNAQLPQDRRIEFRIGITIGDVVVEDGDMFGDGVNVAARLEQLASPGSICLSEDAYRQIRGKIGIAVRDGGAQRLKNIAAPVRVYHIERPMTGARASAAGGDDSSSSSSRKVARSWMLIAVPALVLAVAAGAWWLRVAIWSEGGGEAQVPAAATVVPIVAVLPFANQTGDQSQDYLVDGITEEVINALGRFNTLRVISHNAVLPYKTRAATHTEIATELGASYLVNGSVRQADQRVRIAVQLSDASSGTVLRSDHYDGELSDIFDLQDRIASRTAGTLAANITQVEGLRRREQPKPNPSAYDLVLRARAIGRSSSRTANRSFRELVARAIEVDPNYATARALLAEGLRSMVILGWTEFPDQELARAETEARKAIALAPNEPDGYRALGRILLDRSDYGPAEVALKRAIEINPSDANALAEWGSLKSFVGDITAGIEALELALKLDPALEPTYVMDLAIAYYLARRHEDAIQIAERGLARYPAFPMLNVPAAAAAAQLGRAEAAARYVADLRRRVPFFDRQRFGTRFADPQHAAYLKDGLVAAGL